MTTIENENSSSDSMRTLSEVMEKLRKRGQQNELVISGKGKMDGMGNTYRPQDLTIIKTYRFEGMSDPADNSALYLVEDKDHQIGYILDIYGGESNHDEAGFNEFLKAIPVKNESRD